ncbi:MAG: DUF6498-containing protein [Planctomycetota bacterium]|jgi:hypothetical protein
MTQRPSSLVLILANLIPLAGVLLFQWDILAIMLLYWAESIIIGYINVFKMIFCRTDNVVHGGLPQLAGQPVPEELSKGIPKMSVSESKLFLIPLFIFHYGIFCGAHLVVVVGIFSDTPIILGAEFPLAEYWQASFWIAVAGIAGSHLYSFFMNYIGGGEYKTANLSLLMNRPYGRIFVMHFSIVVGAFLIEGTDSVLPMLLILIGAKTVLDIHLHEKERGKLAAPAIIPA